MKETFLTYKGIQTEHDLQVFDGSVMPGQSYSLKNSPGYPEISLLLKYSSLKPEQVMADSRQLLVVAPTWQLSLTSYGYLEFSATESALKFESALPLISCLDPEQEFVVGLSIINYAYALRATDYAEEGSLYCRVRLFAGDYYSLSCIGENKGFFLPELEPCPELITTGQDSEAASALVHLTVFNTEQMDLCNAKGERTDIVQDDFPQGSAFAPRLLADGTVQVYTRPTFPLSSSYWFYGHVQRKDGAFPQIWVKPIWSRAAQMMPTFFISSDGENWRRILPKRVEFHEGPQEFSLLLDLSSEQGKQLWAASGIPFTPEDRESFLVKMKSSRLATVKELGGSTLGETLHLVRLTDPEVLDTDKVAFAFLAGQHSPLEIMAGWVLVGLADRFLASPEILKRTIIYIVPTVNVDTARFGGGGITPQAKNTNRHWFEGLTPETQAVRDTFLEVKARGENVKLVMDLHAGGTFRNHLLFSFPEEDLEENVAKIQKRWQNLFQKKVGIRFKDSVIRPVGRHKARDWFLEAFNCPSFTLELSSASYYHPQQQRIRPFEQKALTVLSQGLFESIVTFLDEKRDG